MLGALLLAGVASLAPSGPAAASPITFDTRYSAACTRASAAACRSLIDGLAAAPATAGYGGTTLNGFTATSHQSVFRGSATNIACRYTPDIVVEPNRAGT